MIEKFQKRKHSRIQWFCICDLCGKETTLFDFRLACHDWVADNWYIGSDAKDHKTIHCCFECMDLDT